MQRELYTLRTLGQSQKSFQLFATVGLIQIAEFGWVLGTRLRQRFCLCTGLVGLLDSGCSPRLHGNVKQCPLGRMPKPFEWWLDRENFFQYEIGTGLEACSTKVFSNSEICPVLVGK